MLHVYIVCVYNIITFTLIRYIKLRVIVGQCLTENLNKWIRNLNVLGNITHMIYDWFFFCQQVYRYYLTLIY